MWYRAPEILFGSSLRSGPGVDVWSTGAVFSEMASCRPLFKGRRFNEGDDVGSIICTLNAIFEICGTPSETMWPGISKLAGKLAHPRLLCPLGNEPYPRRPILTEELKQTPAALDLLEVLPSARLAAPRGSMYIDI